MKAHLLFRDRDFDLEQKPPVNEAALMQDLELSRLFNVMAEGDDFLLQVVQPVVLAGLHNDEATILYRQTVLRDCLRNPAVVQEIYNLAVEAIEAEKKQWFGLFRYYPDGILSGAVGLLEMLLGILGRLKVVVDQHAGEFGSEGFKVLFALLQAELGDDYITGIKGHLKDLKFRQGVLVSAGLGKGNGGSDYVLKKPPGRPGWFQRLFASRAPGCTFRIAERDEAGARALSALRDRGINLVEPVRKVFAVAFR